MTENNFSLKLLKLLLTIWWWAILLGGIACLVFAFTLASGNGNYELIGYASDIDTSNLSAQDKSGTQLQVKFDGPARVRLQGLNESSEMRPGLAQRLIPVLLMGIMCGFLLFLVKKLKDIVRTIEQGNPFIVENSARVRVIGILVIVYCFADSAGDFFMSGVADSMVIPAGFSLNGHIAIHWGLLMVGIAVIVLSEVFRHGSQIREDQSLTV